MCYKISNIADRETIQKEFRVSFKFPNLHKKNPIIDGLLESTVSVVTQSKPKELTLAIWGILPETFQDDWQHFQNVKNTLNIDFIELLNNENYLEALTYRRCLIIVTGFFTYYLNNGVLYPYYVHLESNKPFAMAGIYNELDDGFITCSILISKSNSFIEKIHNSDAFMPTVLDVDNEKKWIDNTSSSKVIMEIINSSPELALKAYPIAKEFHKIGVVYDSILDPVDYENVPKPSC